MMPNVKIYVENNKVGLKDISNNNVLVPPIYDYDLALKGSYYADPDYYDRCYLYTYKYSNYAIFKLGEQVCVYDNTGKLIEPLTDNIEAIVDKYYWSFYE